MLEIAYTQPYVPKYRVPLFDALSRSLAERGAHLTVFSSQPQGEQASRQDAATGDWHRPLITRTRRLSGRTVEFRKTPAEMRNADVVVSELTALNDLAWRRSMGSRPLILWGHGKPYTNDGGWLSDRVEWALAKRADHVMTYAPSGRDYLVSEGGLRADRVTAIGNSTDTMSIRRAQERLRAEGVIADRPTRAGKTVLFVGALDSTKRLDFVLEAYRHAAAIEPGVQLIVAGEGVMASDVDAAAQDLYGIRRVGDVRGDELVKVAAMSDAIWMPGRVGLVAVDALALGLPIHTTDYPYHAPEAEFLRGREIARLADDPRQFAIESLAEIGNGPVQLRQDIPTVESVAANMVSVIFKVART